MQVNMIRKTSKKAQTVKESSAYDNYSLNHPGTLDNLNAREKQTSNPSSRQLTDLLLHQNNLLPNMKKVLFEFTDESPCNAKDIAPSNSVKIKSSGVGSLESFNDSNRKESNSKERIINPTFGEEELNNKVNNQLEDSPTRGKAKSAKIDKLLEEHKKKKAIQRAVELKKDVQEQNNPYAFEVGPSPKFGIESEEYIKLEQQVIGQSTQNHEKPKRAMNSLDQNLNNNSLHNQSGSLPTSSGGQRLEKSQGFLSAIECTESTYFSDNALEAQRVLSNKKLSKAGSPKTKLRSPKTPKSITKSPVKSPVQSPVKAVPEEVTYGVPKISKNSKKIFKSSVRAQEDQEILEQLYARAKSSTEGDQSNSGRLQNIPEDRLEYVESSRKVQRAEPTSPFSQSQFLRNNNNLSVLSKRSANSPSSSAANTPTGIKDASPLSKFNPTSTDKKSKFGNASNNNATTPQNKIPASKRQDTSRLDQSNITASSSSPTRKLKFSGTGLKNDSPRSSKAGGNSPSSKSPKKTPVFEALDREAIRASRVPSYRTIVEHKSVKSRSPGRKSYKSASPPNTKDLMNIATTTRNIYVKVVNSPPKEKVIEIPEPHPIVKKSALIQNLAAPRQPHFDEMTPEELAQYDEVQRIETMLRNLHKIQKSNLLNYEAQVKEFDASHFVRKNWNDYAEDINESALGRRNIRKKAELEKIARETNSLPPYPMKKSNISLDSFIGSSQLRQSLGSSEDLHGLGSVLTEGDQAKYLGQCGVYERQMLWRGIVEKKTQRLAEFLDNRDYDGCTFSPKFFTKEFNVWNAVPWKLNSPTNLLNSAEKATVSTLQDERLATEVGSMLKEKSLYQEKKTIDTYTELSSLKKVYNLYKSEIFVPKMSTMNSRINITEDGDQRNSNEGYSARFNSVETRMD